MEWCLGNSQLLGARLKRGLHFEHIPRPRIPLLHCEFTAGLVSFEATDRVGVNSVQ